MAMTVKELIDLLAAAVAAERIDLEDELSIAVDSGDEAIIAEIDFLDSENRSLACSSWGTLDTTFSLNEIPSDHWDQSEGSQE